jgi:hypothetical protein
MAFSICIFVYCGVFISIMLLILGRMFLTYIHAICKEFIGVVWVKLNGLVICRQL